MLAAQAERTPGLPCVLGGCHPVTRMSSSPPPLDERPNPATVHLDERDRRLLEAVDDAETLGLLFDLIARRSENPPGNELSCAKALSAWLEDRGVACELDEVLPGRPNLYASVGGPGPTLVLCGHLDTVPAGRGWTHEPFQATLADGLVYGRGACDMKAGLAAMAGAIVAVASSGVSLRGSVALHGVIDEEVGSAGARKAADEHPGDWAIVTEPTDCEVLSMGNGQANFEIVFQGKAVHSSHPEDGRNAISDAAALVRLIEEETHRLALYPFQGIGPATYSVCLIEGGRGGSTVADRCQLTVDRRILPSESLEGAEARIVQLIDELAAKRPGLSCQMSRSVAFPPLRGTGSGYLARALTGAVGDLTGKGGGEKGMRFATDAAWYEAAGCEAVVFGPGDVGVAHEPDERVSVDALYVATRALALCCGRMLA